MLWHVLSQEVLQVVELLVPGMEPDKFCRFGRSFFNWEWARTVQVHSQKTYVGISTFVLGMDTGSVCKLGRSF